MLFAVFESGDVGESTVAGLVMTVLFGVLGAICTTTSNAADAADASVGMRREMERPVLRGKPGPEGCANATSVAGGGSRSFSFASTAAAGPPFETTM